MVVAADSRGDVETFAGYAALADRCFRIEYRIYERHLEWLHAQCSADWILRLDDDEVLSAAFVARCQALARRARRAAVLDAARVVVPGRGQRARRRAWSVDFNNRLVRNDGTLRFPGVQHSGAAPAEPVRVPGGPDLPPRAGARRTGRAARQGGPLRGRPAADDRSGRRPDERGVLRPRAARVAADAAGARGRSRGDRPRARGDRDDRGARGGRHSARHGGGGRPALDGRAVAPSAYRGTIEPVGAPPTLAPGEGRSVLVCVTNEGTEVWPRGLDWQPAIRPSYHWLRADGSSIRRTACAPASRATCAPASGSSCRSASWPRRRRGATCSRPISSTRPCAGSSRGVASRWRSARRRRCRPRAAAGRVAAARRGCGARAS